jgi:ABC-2 type transport system ATP-binding protein
MPVDRPRRALLEEPDDVESYVAKRSRGFTQADSGDRVVVRPARAARALEPSAIGTQLQTAEHDHLRPSGLPPRRALPPESLTWHDLDEEAPAPTGTKAAGRRAFADPQPTQSSLPAPSSRLAELLGEPAPTDTTGRRAFTDPQPTQPSLPALPSRLAKLLGEPDAEPETPQPRRSVLLSSIEPVAEPPKITAPEPRPADPMQPLPVQPPKPAVAPTPAVARTEPTQQYQPAAPIDRLTAPPTPTSPVDWPSSALRRAQGAPEITQGAAEITRRAEQIHPGAGQITRSAAQSTQRAGQINPGAGRISEGARPITERAGQINQGAPQPTQRTEQISQGAGEINHGSGRVTQSVGQVTQSPRHTTQSAGQINPGGAAEITRAVPIRPASRVMPAERPAATLRPGSGQTVRRPPAPAAAQARSSRPTVHHDVSPIIVDRLIKSYGGTLAVHNLSFVVEPGRVTGFLGPNGAGKTTTMRILLGLVTPTTGTATFGSLAYADLPHPQRTVGCVLDARFHPGRSGRNHLRVLAPTARASDRRVDELLGEVGLGEVARQPVGEYSMGMQQRLALAAAMLGEPDYLVLDEPANGLDPEGIRWLRTFLRDFAASGRAVFISSHQLNEIEATADDIVVINRGRLLAQMPMSELNLGEGTTRARVSDLSAARQALATIGADVEIAADERGAYLRVHSHDVGQVGSALFGSGIVVDELGTERRDLEQEFLSMLEGSR